MYEIKEIKRIDTQGMTVSQVWHRMIQEKRRYPVVFVDSGFGKTSIVVKGAG